MESNKFKSVPNFRKVSMEQNSVTSRWPLYRSSKPDFLCSSEVDHYNSLGIRTILDFRSFTEYKRSKGNKILDANYPSYKVKFPLSYKYKPDENVIVDNVKLNNKEHPLIAESGRHIFIDFFKMDYVLAIFSRAPWYIQLYSFLWLIVDFILNTHYRYFVQVFAKTVLNPVGLGGQYTDFLLYSGNSISAS